MVSNLPYINNYRKIAKTVDTTLYDYTVLLEISNIATQSYRTYTASNYYTVRQELLPIVLGFLLPLKVVIGLEVMRQISNYLIVNANSDFDIHIDRDTALDTIEQNTNDNLIFLKYAIAGKIASIISDAIKTGKSKTKDEIEKEITKEIKKVFERQKTVIKNYRQDRIGTIYNAINVAKAKKYNIKYWKWLTNAPQDTPCVMATNEVQEVGKPFSNGYISPLVHNRCQCVVIPVA